MSLLQNKKRVQYPKITYARIFLLAVFPGSPPHTTYASHRPPRLSSMPLLLFSALVPLSEPRRGPPFRPPFRQPVINPIILPALFSLKRSHADPFIPYQNHAPDRRAHFSSLKRAILPLAHPSICLCRPFARGKFYFARSAGGRSPETRPFRQKPGLLLS